MSSSDDGDDVLEALLAEPLPELPARPPLLDPGHILGDDRDIDNIVNDLLEDSDESDESMDHEGLANFRRQRLRRSTDTWHYSGDVKKAIQEDHFDEVKNWSSLPGYEFKRLWMAEFRMTADVFAELLELLQPHMLATVPRNSNLRTYTVEDKLMVTINFLAHCPTLRQMAQKWGMPHNSISHICLHPTTQALRMVLLEDRDTRTILWPKEKEAQEEVMNTFLQKYRLPGCIGAIDGSLIPMRKPTKEQANQDTDSYYGYKGGIASLLLAVCDANLKFLYINAGAPACVGDAGLFSKTTLRSNIDNGALKQVRATTVLTHKA